jgi:hypothetical protein
MARPLRLDYCSAVWHLTARGNDRQNIAVTITNRQASSIFAGFRSHVGAGHGRLIPTPRKSEVAR